MPRFLTFATAALAALALPAAAQDVRIVRPDIERLVIGSSDRPMIGISTPAASERGDTLGLRIEAVTAGSPAERAGLKAGDRLQSVDGVSLRADRADAGESDYAGVLTRRLQRALERVKSGESVELRVLSGGTARTVRVTPVKASELSPARTMARIGPEADRAVLGLNIASTGSARDTLGVFVSAVTPGGPAEKAGIIEGDRIASINGVSLRVAREDAEDRAVGAARADRLMREVAKLTAGEMAELVVVSGGRSRTVRVTSVKASELPGGERNVWIFRSPEGSGGTFRFEETPPMRLQMPEIEQRLRELAPRFEEMRPRLDELRRRLETEATAARMRSRVVI